MCTTHDRLNRLFSKTLNDAFDPTFFVFIEFRYTFKYWYRKITEQRQIFANSDRYTNEDAEIILIGQKKVLHSLAWDGTGRCIKEGVLRRGSVRGTSVRTGRVCWYNGDRSLPVSLDMWDGRKAVQGWHCGRFQDLRLPVACPLLLIDHIIVTDSNKCC